MAYDVIVAGGGTAGCVCAARLSEDAGRRVLLLEAGPDYPAVPDLPADVADGSGPTTDHDWGFVSEPDELGRVIPLPRGRLVGGCSATNACFALRGWPADYDEWAARGNAGWSFRELLPLFRAIEADGDVGGAWHGRTGPVPISRPRELSPLQRAFLDAAVADGHPLIEDHNRPGAMGVGVAPRNVRGPLRMSTALTYLAAARERPNLTIRPGAVVDRVELSGTAVRGVRLADGGVIEAEQVVVTAGSYGSPAILLRSGIGPASHLREVGIPVAVDLAGVGENLVDHPLVAVDLPAPPGDAGPGFQVMLTLRSTRAEPDGPPDLHLFAVGPFAEAASPSGRVFGIVAGLLAVRSRGSVRLRSATAAEPPRIDVGHLRHPEDLARMVEAVRHARHISRTPPLARFAQHPELAPGTTVEDGDPVGLARAIRRRVGSYHHPVGTCAMGPDPAAGAVVDARGAVHGIRGLWVADASVIPTVPSANTLLSTIVVAERIAARLVPC